MMNEEEGTGMLRFHALVSLIACPPPGVRTAFDQHLSTFTEADLVDQDGKPLPSMRRAVSGEQTARYVPLNPGYCCIGRQLFLAGGVVSDKDAVPNLDGKKYLWYLDTAAPPEPTSDSGPDVPDFCWTWRLCPSRLEEMELDPLLVPYDGKLFIFGGTMNNGSWFHVYDLQSGKFERVVDVHEHIWMMARPCGYFLWSAGTVATEDGKKLRKKPLIMLHFDHYPECSLYSYDMESDQLEIFDKAFPGPPDDRRRERRNLIPLDCNRILIIDQPDCWGIYDVSLRRLTGKVKVEKLKKHKDLFVNRAFCRCCPDGTLIFSIFMFDDQYGVGCSHDIPYAKVRLQPKEQELMIATVELEGSFKVGAWADLLLFAEQTNKRTGEGVPLAGGPEKKVKP